MAIFLCYACCFARAALGPFWVGAPEERRFPEPPRLARSRPPE